MLDHVVLQRGIEQMVAVEIEAAPLERCLRGALEELTCRVAEVLRHVDALDPSLRLRRGPARTSADTGAAIAEEVREEVVEEAAAAEVSGQPLLGDVDLAEVLDLLRPVGKRAHPLCDRRPPVPLAVVLLGRGHQVLTSILRRCAFSAFGTRTRSTPSLRLASMFSPST